MNSGILRGLLALAALLSNTISTNGARILAVYSFPGKSHFMMQKALIKELVEHGNQVTMITAFSMAPMKLGSNYTEILIEPVYDFWKDVKEDAGAKSIFDMTTMDLFGFLQMLQVLGTTTTEHALKQPKVQAIVNAKQTEDIYDLLLVEQFYQEAFLALSYIYKIPVVSSSTLGYENHMSQMFGIMSPWSYVPHGFLPFTDRMSFWERLQNTFYSLCEDLHREYKYFPLMDELVAKYFGHLPIDFPKVSVMEKHLSAVLLNSYVPLTSTRPTTNAMIPVGGMHIYPAKALPADMQKFLDEAKHGAIYFSLGSNVESKDMPAAYLNIFLDVFRDMKQRVLWKYENDSIQNLPPNVMVKKWMPQSDILAHPNVRVFITHGGLLGTQEGVHYAVAMLGMPFYCDQHLNLKKAALSGYAISLHFQSITYDVLKNALTELLENPSYRDNIKRISRIFHDRPLSARDTAVYWVEYVARHKGAEHMRAAGLDLKWYEFYLLDVITFVIGVVVVVLALFVGLLRFALRRLGSSNKQKKKLQ
ncbi:UDP-glycosyltransferase UGT5-like [Rhagoletis pomonella]|uniref:UDP-glycosyltransferase UGT5-like n=1 Tax=Rhagoletis pomonella TaxID=28610 RepID=UPI0017820F08|nr:UDP-glycosyltransferase UGT5-like [Rhagoletis pomonella]